MNLKKVPSPNLVIHVHCKRVVGFFCSLRIGRAQFDRALKVLSALSN